jgi:hypothetical protein
MTINPLISNLNMCKDMPFFVMPEAAFDALRSCYSIEVRIRQVAR